MQGELGDLTIRVSVDKEAKTLTVTDRGVGMTAEEVDRYINQIAFSGAEEFMARYKDQAIIGHFGLGFYSSFMVSDKVEIITRSFREGPERCAGAARVPPSSRWRRPTRRTTAAPRSCCTSRRSAPEYADEAKIEGLLKKYCRFLPVPIAFGKVKEWKDGKYVDTDRDNVINNVEPLWTRKPSEMTEEQYKEFYRELYPMSDDPLFSIHLNIDYPFHLTGILYFPKIHNNFEIQKNKIQLYSNQVFVTDQVEGIVPEYLTLLHGVIDSPDIPLNVSRSYLQSDANVKKISSYITRKVADRLQELFTTMRADYEAEVGRSEDLHPVRHHHRREVRREGLRFHALEECRRQLFHGQGVHRPGEGEPDRQEQDADLPLCGRPRGGKARFPGGGQGKGYDVLEMNGQLDNHYINWYESKHNDCRFVRVDSDVVEKLIQKQTHAQDGLSEGQQELLRPVFESQMPAGREDPLQHLVRGHGARGGAGCHYAERVHAPHEGDGGHGRRRRHEPVLRTDAR